MNLILFASDTNEPWYRWGVFMQYMHDGGHFMWPILVLAVIALGVVIERYRSLKMLTSINQAELRERVLDLMHADRVKEALVLCNKARGPEAAILSVGIRKFLLLRHLDYDADRIEQEVSKAMDDYGVHIVAALERHLPILATIASVAPMLGSVGTVVGMVILFKDIAAMKATEQIVKIAAAGIQVKLIVTVWGLLVGIPAYVAYNYFTTLIHRYVLQVEETATELMESVTLRLAQLQHEEKNQNRNLDELRGHAADQQPVQTPEKTNGTANHANHSDPLAGQTAVKSGGLEL